jgi:WD40 repeat protein
MCCINFWVQVHSGGVTQLLVTHKYIFTTSADCTVKVWHARTNNQLGQFYCQAPVTAMCQVGDSGNNGGSGSKQAGIQLMLGDQLGNVYVLTWQS